MSRLNDLMTTTEVASYMGKSTRTVQRWHELGHLRALGKVGRSHVYKRADVEARMNELISQMYAEIQARRDAATALKAGGSNA